jgi:hypothetical protein
MNENFYAYAIDLIKNLSTEDLEERLLDFGFEVQRKVNLYSALETSSSFIDFPAAALIEELVSFEVSMSIAYAANDNSYALAA